MDPRLVQLIRCPITKNPLRPLTEEEIAALNVEINSRSRRHHDGSEIETRLEEGLITEDKRYAYPVVDGIAALLPEMAIPMEARHGDTDDRRSLRKEKESVRDFYDNIGWKKEGDLYADTSIFVDKREVSREYLHNCSQRIANAVESPGGYLLDVASGVVPRGRSTNYAQTYEHHVCVDISIRALREAKVNLGERGLYILGDITNLPLSDGAVDGAVSLHTIYHVPKDEQRAAFLELYRVIKPGAVCAVAYSWGRHALLPNLPVLPIQLYRFLKKRLAPRRRGGRSIRGLYFHAHSFGWFKNQSWPFPVDVRPLRSLNTQFLRVYIHPWLAGRQLLAIIFKLEGAFPRLAGRLGYYPLMIIRRLPV